MARFIFAGYAVIENIRIRKEGPGDDKALAVDVRFMGRATSALCAFFDPVLHSFLFEGSVARTVTYQMQPVSYAIEVEHCDLQLLGCTFRDVHLRRFQVTPVDGEMIDLRFVARFQPSKDELAILAEFVDEEVHLVVQPQPELDFGLPESSPRTSRTKPSDTTPEAPAPAPKAARRKRTKHLP